MKRGVFILLVFVLFLGLFKLKAQSTMVLNPKSQTKNTTINTSVDAVVSMLNTDTRTLKYRISASPLSSIPSGSGWQICYGSYCYGGSPTLAPSTSAPPAELAANATETLKFTYEPDVNTGTVTIKFCVFNNDNPLDSSCTMATYVVTSSSSIKDMMNPHKPQVQIASQNPAADFISFNYQIHPNNRNVTLLLINPLGQAVAQQNLTDLQGLALMYVGNLPNGIYYAYAHSQSEPVCIGKIVVAH